METTIHNIVKITRLSRADDLYEDGTCYVQKFMFEDKNGNSYKIICFAKNKDNLKIQGAKRL